MSRARGERENLWWIIYELFWRLKCELKTLTTLTPLSLSSTLCSDNHIWIEWIHSIKFQWRGYLISRINVCVLFAGMGIGISRLFVFYQNNFALPQLFPPPPSSHHIQTSKLDTLHTYIRLLIRYVWGSNISESFQYSIILKHVLTLGGASTSPPPPTKNVKQRERRRRATFDMSTSFESNEGSMISFSDYFQPPPLEREKAS